MITLIVNITATHETYWDYVDACRLLAKQTLLNERQCRAYTVNKHPEDENGIVLVEVYDNQEAIDFHKTTNHFLEWREAVKDWGERKVTRYESL